jgi:hypothetical protein
MIEGEMLSRVTDERLTALLDYHAIDNTIDGAGEAERSLALDLRDARAALAKVEAECARLKAERDDAVDKLRRWGYVENPQQQLQLSRAQVAALEKRCAHDRPHADATSGRRW